jgi:hypothetical protein
MSQNHSLNVKGGVTVGEELDGKLVGLDVVG